MGDGRHLGMHIVDGHALDRSLREVLRPAELVPDRHGRRRRLPRFFYRVDSWERALEIRLAPHFAVHLRAWSGLPHSRPRARKPRSHWRRSASQRRGVP